MTDPIQIFYIGGRKTPLCVSPPDKRALLKKKDIFLFLNQNICYGYSREPSQSDSSCEHPKHKFKAMDK